MISLILTIGLIGAEMPQIPFDVVDPVLGRTIHVKSSCDTNKRAFMLLLSDTTPLDNQLTAVLMQAFRTEGVTIINVCRTKGQ